MFINLRSHSRPEVFLSVPLAFFLHCINVRLVSTANIKMYRYYNVNTWNILNKTQMRKNVLESLLQYYSFERKVEGYNPFSALN